MTYFTNSTIAGFSKILGSNTLPNHTFLVYKILFLWSLDWSIFPFCLFLLFFEWLLHSFSINFLFFRPGPLENFFFFFSNVFLFHYYRATRLWMEGPGPLWDMNLFSPFLHYSNSIRVNVLILYNLYNFNILLLHYNNFLKSFFF